MNYMRTIQIFCNYYENYNYAEGSKPYYKIKGTHVFEMEVNFDDLMYREDELRRVIGDLISCETNPKNLKGADKYIIRSIEIKDEVTVLPKITTETLNNRLQFRKLRKNTINYNSCSPAAKETLSDLSPDQVLIDNIDGADYKKYKLWAK